MKRLGIYLTYDKQGIIDRYVGYMLKELKTCIDYLVVVCNETVIASGIEFLQEFSDIIFYRENIGLDAGGFKDALTKFLGWEKVLGYDELVLVNDSLFGPFSPMKNIFDVMEKKSVDFWGISSHGEYKKEGLDYFPEHIQSFFITICSSMLHSTQFINYWENMPYYASYNQVVREHEMQFTLYFSRLGYKYDVFADIEINNSLNPENNYCQFMVICYELIKKRNFPFLKKQQIANDKITQQTQEELFEAINYIDKFTDYNIDLIWENIIRTLDITDLQKNLHLQYIISTERKYENYGRKIVIIVCISYYRSAEAILEYLENLDFSIKIIAEHSELLREYKKRGFECEIVSKIDKLEFFQKFCDYDLVCIINDTDLTSEIKPNYIGKSYFYNVWNNLIKNKKHILAIQEIFEKNPYLGVLTNPQPNFGEFFGELGKSWDSKFEEVYTIIKEKKLLCQISEDKPPFRKPENLWIRGKLLAKLENWNTNEMEYLSYLWIYIAQDSGYYSGLVESPEYAAINEINLQYYLEEITELVRKQYGDFDNFIELKKRISQSYLYDFCKKYNRILVYGTGIIAKKYKPLLPKPEAYIVSDGQIKLPELDGIPIKYLSEIEKANDCGIILCLNKKNQIQAIENLKKYGIKNYLCV